MDDIVRPIWRHIELARNSKPRNGKQYVELNEEKRRDNYVVTFERNSLARKLCPARMESRLGNCLNEGPGEIAMSVKMPPPCG